MDRKCASWALLDTPTHHFRSWLFPPNEAHLDFVEWNCDREVDHSKKEDEDEDDEDDEVEDDANDGIGKGIWISFLLLSLSTNNARPRKVLQVSSSSPQGKDPYHSHNLLTEKKIKEKILSWAVLISSVVLYTFKTQFPLLF